MTKTPPSRPLSPQIEVVTKIVSDLQTMHSIELERFLDYPSQLGHDRVEMMEEVLEQVEKTLKEIEEQE